MAPFFELLLPPVGVQHSGCVWPPLEFSIQAAFGRLKPEPLNPHLLQDCPFAESGFDGGADLEIS